MKYRNILDKISSAAHNNMASTIVGAPDWKYRRHFQRRRLAGLPADERCGRLPRTPAESPHTILGDMVAEGQISPEEARSAASFRKGLSCQFIADAEFDELNVNIANHEMQPGELLLLCSDGLNEVMSDVAIAAPVRQKFG